MCIIIYPATLYNILHQEYEEECSKLECLLGTMEQNIKRLLSDFDSKKKVSLLNVLYCRHVCTVDIKTTL